jgi:hypothetical protein
MSFERDVGGASDEELERRGRWSKRIGDGEMQAESMYQQLGVLVLLRILGNS